MHFIKLLQLLLSIAPSVIQTVQAVEKAIPGKGQGSKKLELVTGMVQAAANIAPEIHDEVISTRDGLREIRKGNITPEAVSQVTEGITQIINTTVRAFNDTGVFPRGSDNPE